MQYIKAVWFSTVILICSSVSSIAELGTTRPASIEARAVRLLKAEVADPQPSNICQAPLSKCDYGSLYHALAELYADTEATAQSHANEDLAVALPHLASGIGSSLPDTADERDPEEMASPFHFQRALMLYRMLRFFGKGGSRIAQAIRPDIEQSILDLFQRWSSSHCRLADADPNSTWRIWGSENHHAQLIASCWAAADLLRHTSGYTDARYVDGSSVEQQYAQWVRYISAYLRERGRYGLIESDSPTYAAYTLETFYNYVDFADDPEQRRLAKAFLDLWWAQWVAEQIQGTVGASKSRVYPEALDSGSPSPTAAWTYFGLGAYPSHNPAAAAALTSMYVPPVTLREDAGGGSTPGSYDVVATAPGRLVTPKTGRSEWYVVDPSAPAIVRRTHVAPGFIMGASMLPLYPAKLWAGSSSQNRWDGVVLAGGRAQRVALLALPARGKATYNALQAVQSGAAQIVQAYPAPFSVNVGEMQVRFGGGLQPIETQGWIFVDSSAYVAVKVVRGGYERDLTKPGSFRLLDPSSPVILQAATKSDFRDLNAFQDAVLRAQVIATSDSVDYQGVGKHERMRLYEGGIRPPEIDGASLDFTPADSVQSPLVTMNRNTGAGQICEGLACSSLRF